MSEQEAYELCKRLESVEKRFDTYKSTLSADRLYLQDNENEMDMEVPKKVRDIEAMLGLNLFPTQES